MGDYDDIIHHPHHVSHNHPPMSMLSRAAQFAPFAALTGYHAAIEETARTTDSPIELGEDDCDRLNRILAQLMTQMDRHPYVCIVCFTPDLLKSGGTYVEMEGHLKRVDEITRQLHFCDGTSIPLDNIIDIRSADSETEPDGNTVFSDQ